MCRLAAWSGISPRTAAAALGDDGVERLDSLARQHCDGWGMAWRPLAGGRPLRVRSPTPAAQDPAFRSAMTATPTTAGLAHLRWATPGLPVTEANAHPFMVGDLAMAHNGGIYPLDRVGDILDPVWEERVTGTTDSEHYVLAVAARLAAGLSPVDALIAAVRYLFAGWAPTSLNATALFPEVLLAVCAFDPEAPVSIPEPAEEYYAMAWTSDADGVAVASSGVYPADDRCWQLLPNPSVLVVPAGGTPSVVPFDAPIGSRRASGGQLR